MRLRVLALAAAALTACHGNDSPADGGSDAGDGGNVVQDFGSACAAPANLAVPTPRACTAGDMPTIVAGNGGDALGPAKAPVDCQRPVACTSFGSTQAIALGAHTVGERVSFNVPPNTGSFSIVSQALAVSNDSITVAQGGKSFTLDNTVVPDLVRGPDGGTLYDDNNLPDAGDWPLAQIIYGGGSPGSGVMTVPNSTAALNGGVAPGQYSFVVNDYAYECSYLSGCGAGSASTTNKYDVQVLFRPGPVATAGQLDVNLFIASTHGGTLKASTASTNASVRRMVQTLSKIYARAGLCIGTVTAYDLPAWAQTKYSTISADDTGPCSELSQLFTLSVPGNALNFFLVEDITGKDVPAGGTIVGLDGTIPGPSTLGGTIHSGAAVSVADLTAGAGNCGSVVNLGTCGADEVAYIAAHEGGHWMGLFHTTESTGDGWDSLDDTAICDCTTCCTGSNCAASCSSSSSSPTVLPASVCRSSTKTQCQGGDNLMFWQYDSSSVGNLSTQQGQVMRSNALVR